jgi:hypothetical protein
MRIWYKHGLAKFWIEDVESFDIKTSMELDGNIHPVSPRFVCRHGSGAFSVTPVENLLTTRWGVIPCSTTIDMPILMRQSETPQT